MARHLGDFGTPREALDDTFGWLGETFRVHPDLTDLYLFEFMEQAKDIDENDERRAMTLVTAQLAGLVHADDWKRFLAHSIAHRQHYRDLMTLMKGLIEATAGDRPTQRPSDSPPGRRKTKGKSKRTSSGRAEAGGPAKVIRRLELAGRPDLALHVVEAVEQQQTG